jgi:FMN-dependent oxidoreductase (nitrilotriacetate monooxygenase family)
LTKEILINAFGSDAPGHPLSPGYWRHSRDKSVEHSTLEFWTELARLLERGLFDGLFIADTIGVNDTHNGSAEASIRLGLQIPRHDPVLTIPAMALVTKHLGFGVTLNLSYEPPYLLARRLSTLDHLTRGRIGWNIVTGFLESATKATGGDKIVDHDTRYDIGDEYMDIVYKLWEGSWEDGAVLRDRERGIYADPSKVHKIKHDGKYFRLEGIHMVDPSPQRTPVLYQAGGSSRGRQFAAQHAECVFIGGPSKTSIAATVTDIRSRAEALGRRPEEILLFTLATVIVGPTEAEAKAKFDDYYAHMDLEGSLTLMSGLTGIDFSKYGLDEPIPEVSGNAMRSLLTVYDSSRVWTVRDVAEQSAIGGRGPKIVGTPKQVVDELQDWMESTGIDGFNLCYVTMPGDFVDFVDLVVPELQRRGLYKTEYRRGTLREKLYGAGRSLLPVEHPAATRRVIRA